MAQPANPQKTVLIAALCILALAVAGVSAYNAFGPKGTVTQGGSFGTKAGEVSQDQLPRAPQGAARGSQDQRVGDDIAGAPADNGPGDRGQGAQGGARN